MSFSEIMGKMGRNEPLDPGELQQLRDETRSIEEVMNLVKGWVVPGTSTPKFQPPIETIYSTILNEDTASIDVRIPNVYKHLLIMGAGRVTGAGAGVQYILARYNADSGTNYHQQKLTAASTVVTGTFDSSQTGAIVGLVIEGGVAAGLSGSFETKIPHHMSNHHKNAIMQGAVRGQVHHVTTEWANTAAIEKINFFPVTDSFAAGFVLSVYGIK